MASSRSKFLCALALGFVPLACGITESKEIPYPPMTIVEDEQSNMPCPIGLAAFDFHIKPMLESRCTAACHAPNGNAASSLVFLGESTVDSQALRTREGGTADGIFRKASGLIPHVGGAAARPDDLNRFEKWFAAELLCK